MWRRHHVFIFLAAAAVLHLAQAVQENNVAEIAADGEVVEPSRKVIRRQKKTITPATSEQDGDQESMQSQSSHVVAAGIDASGLVSKFSAELAMSNVSVHEEVPISSIESDAFIEQYHRATEEVVRNFLEAKQRRQTMVGRHGQSVMKRPFTHASSQPLVQRAWAAVSDDLMHAMVQLEYRGRTLKYDMIPENIYHKDAKTFHHHGDNGTETVRHRKHGPHVVRSDGKPARMFAQRKSGILIGSAHLPDDGTVNGLFFYRGHFIDVRPQKNAEDVWHVVERIDPEAVFRGTEDKDGKTMEEPLDDNGNSLLDQKTGGMTNGMRGGMPNGMGKPGTDGMSNGKKNGMWRPGTNGMLMANGAGRGDCAAGTPDTALGNKVATAAGQTNCEWWKTLDSTPCGGHLMNLNCCTTCGGAGGFNAGNSGNSGNNGNGGNGFNGGGHNANAGTGDCTGTCSAHCRQTGKEATSSKMSATPGACSCTCGAAAGNGGNAAGNGGNAAGNGGNAAGGACPPGTADLAGGAMCKVLKELAGNLCVNHAYIRDQCCATCGPAGAGAPDPGTGNGQPPPQLGDDGDDSTYFEERPEDIETMDDIDQWWGNSKCFTDDDEMHDFQIGIVIDKSAWDFEGAALVPSIDNIILKTNVVYERQFHTRLVKKDDHIYKEVPSRAQTADKPWLQEVADCMDYESMINPFSETAYDSGEVMTAKLSAFGVGYLNKVWTQYGMNILFSACSQKPKEMRDRGCTCTGEMVNGKVEVNDCCHQVTAGCAWLGGMCTDVEGWQDTREWRDKWGMQIVQGPVSIVKFKDQHSWNTFAHELGHAFGGHHTFERRKEGARGILSYSEPDVYKDGKSQFNTRFRMAEMCWKLDRAVCNCKQHGVATDMFGFSTNSEVATGVCPAGGYEHQKEYIQDPGVGHCTGQFDGDVLDSSKAADDNNANWCKQDTDGGCCFGRYAFAMPGAATGAKKTLSSQWINYHEDKMDFCGKFCCGTCKRIRDSGDVDIAGSPAIAR